MQHEKLSIFQRAVAAFAAFGAVAAFSFIKFVNPADSNLFPQCPFYQLTGLSCPGCGATRGLHALFNGDVLAALNYNILLVLFLPLIIYGFLVLLSLAVRGRGLPFPQLAPSAIWSLAIVLFGFGVLRNLPFYPFTILAP